MLPAFAALPTSLAQMKYTDTLGDSKDCAWQRHTQNPDSFFEWLNKNEAFTAKYHDTMAEMNMGKPDWTEVFPVEQMTHQTKEGRVMLIDLGGGQGRDLEKFRKKFPDFAPGSLVLQDTRACLKSADVHPDIKKMEHDFFKPQPIKGGFECRRILKDFLSFSIIV